MVFNGVSETDRIIIALTSLALNAPSTYTIAWSKGDPDKLQHYPILYAGIASSLATVTGAILGHTKLGNYLMWGGLFSTFILFTYVVFGYQKPISTAFMVNGLPRTVIYDGTEILVV